LHGPGAPPIEKKTEQNRRSRARDKFQFKSELVRGVTRWHQRNYDAQEHNGEAESTGNPDADNPARHENGVRVFSAIFSAIQLDDRREHR